MIRIDMIVRRISCRKWQLRVEHISNPSADGVAKIVIASGKKNTGGGPAAAVTCELHRHGQEGRRRRSGQG